MGKAIWRLATTTTDFVQGPLHISWRTQHVLKRQDKIVNLDMSQPFWWAASGGVTIFKGKTRHTLK